MRSKSGLNKSFCLNTLEPFAIAILSEFGRGTSWMPFSHRGCGRGGQDFNERVLIVRFRRKNPPHVPVRRGEPDLCHLDDGIAVCVPADEVRRFAFHNDLDLLIARQPM
jgi:hypothetical protein